MQKQLVISISLFFLSFFIDTNSMLAQNVGIGTTTPDPSAIIDLNSNTAGALFPRMNSADMNNISNPAQGLCLYNTDSSSLFVYTGTVWTKLLNRLDQNGFSNTSNLWSLNGNAATNTTHFVGTTDSRELVFKVNSQKAGFLGLPGKNRTAVGYRALNSDTSVNNTAVGFEAMLSNMSGANNTAFGFNTLRTNSAGLYNTAIGSFALQSNLSSNNTALGYSALNANVSGSINTAVGTYALYANSVGTENEALGYAAMMNNTSACGNTALGNMAMFTQSYNNSNFIWLSYNTAVGYHALYSNQPTSTANANRNTAVGANSLLNNTQGSNNSAFGFNANVSIGSLNNATAIGANALVSASNSLVLGNQANVGIGLSAPASKLHVFNASAPADVIVESDIENSSVGIAAKVLKEAALNLYNYSGGGVRVLRWKISKDAQGEPGFNNSGSNFALGRYDDAGNFIDNPISITRTDGQVNISKLQTANVKLNHTSVTTNYTVSTNDNCIIYTGLGGTSIDLSTATESGRQLYILNHGNGSISLSPGYVQDVSNTLNTSLGAGARISLLYDGSKWVRLN